MAVIFGQLLSLPRQLAALCGLAVWILAGRTALPQRHEAFESTESSWRLAEADCRPRVLAQQRVFQDAHSGQGCEYLLLYAGVGATLYLTHEIERASVIAELAPSLWVKSDRVGLQLSVRVVLPRTQMASSGKPIMTLVRGQSYERIGQWQRLEVPDLERALARQIPVLRTQYDTPVDHREAFVDLVVLNAYGGPGLTNVWIDDLEVSGLVSTASISMGVDAGGADQSPWRTVGEAAAVSSLPVPQDDHVRLQDSVLLVEGKPLLPKMIDHNGESFEWLRSLGFNVIKLGASPSAPQLREADRLGLWLVAPPPHTDGRLITGQYDRVLAWSLGTGLGQRELEATRRLAGEVRLADQRSHRPLVCAAHSELWAYSQLANLLIFDRLPVGGSFELADYSKWLRERACLGRLGSPFWARVQTEPAQETVRQLAALSADGATLIGIEPEQIRWLAYGAVAAGARGICFQSQSRLDATDQAARLRALTLQLLNLELSLLEPWAAAGSYVDGVDSSDPRAQVAVLRAEHAQLLILLRSGAEQQYVVGPENQGAVSVVVPFAPAAPQVLRLTPAGLQPVDFRRQTGGLRVTLHDAGLASLVVIAQDPQVISHLSHKLTAAQQVAAKLQHEIAAMRLATTRDVVASLEQLARAQPGAEAALDAAEANLQQCGRLLGTGDAQGAQVFASRAMRSLATVRRSHWEEAVRGFCPVASPCCVTFAALPLHWKLAQRLTAAQWGPNGLAAGGFESLDHMISSGWRQYRRQQTGVHTMVDLSPYDPRSGRTSLRMQVLAPDATAAPDVLEACPLWVASPPLSVRAGQLVRIHAWVRVPHPIQGSRDGLMVFDSLGGLAMAYRIQETGGWRELTFYRAAVEDAELKVTFALTGFGEAWVDEVAVSLLDPQLATASPQKAIAARDTWTPAR